MTSQAGACRSLPPSGRRPRPLTERGREAARPSSSSSSSCGGGLGGGDDPGVLHDLRECESVGGLGLQQPHQQVLCRLRDHLVQLPHLHDTPHPTTRDQPASQPASARQPLPACLPGPAGGGHARGPGGPTLSRSSSRLSAMSRNLGSASRHGSSTGGTPVSRMNRMTPRAHTSTA